MTQKFIPLTSDDRKILERVRRVHRQFEGHTAVVETQDVADAKRMSYLADRARQQPLDRRDLPEGAFETVALRNIKNVSGDYR